MKPTPHATKTLDVHDDVADFPELSQEQYAALKASIEKRGILQPIVIAKLKVVDGRHRLRIAKELGLATVPVIESVDVAPLDYALESAIAGRQLTKSAIVLILWEKHPALAEDRGARMKAGKRPSDSITGSELAARYRVPREYFSLIAAVWDSTTEAGWQKARTAILEDEISLPRIRAGAAGAAATSGSKKNATNYFSTCRTGLVSIREAFKNWKKVPLDKRTEIKKLWDELHENVPGDLE